MIKSPGWLIEAQTHEALGHNPGWLIEAQIHVFPGQNPEILIGDIFELCQVNILHLVYDETHEIVDARIACPLIGGRLTVFFQPHDREHVVHKKPMFHHFRD